MERVIPSIEVALSGEEVLSPAVVALGNFDGVHRGHQAVIKTTLDHARRMGLPARILTFEPHPQRILRDDHNPFRLTPSREKIRFLASQGVDEVAIVTFSEEMSRMAAQDFTDRVLAHYCGARHVVAGFDFVFGHGQSGNMHSLRSWLRAKNIDLTEVAPLRDGQGEILSSTRIRKALREGNMELAQKILGRPWSIVGNVMHGVQRGSLLGFPTANMSLGDYLRPKFGVYIINARPYGQSATFSGVANIGVRPTIGDNQEMLEIHLFDFRADIYGQAWEVDLIHFLRPEQVFSDLRALQTQIAQDVAQAKAYFAQPISF